MPLKIRGAKKDQLQQEFDNVRKQTLEVIKRSATDAETEWKVMTVERYKETHEGKDPVAEGLTVTPQMYRGKWHDCVLFRMQAEGEWKLVEREGTEVRKKDEIDDGKNILRKDQLEDKFKNIDGQINQARNAVASNELLEESEEEEEAQEEEANAGSDSDDHSSIMDEECGSDSEDVLNTVIALTPRKKDSAKAQAKSKAKAKAGHVTPKVSRKGTPAASGQPAKKLRTAPALPEDSLRVGLNENPDVKPNDNGKHKSDSSPKQEADLDIESYLERTGLTELNTNIEKVKEDMRQNKVLADPASDEKSMKAELKEISRSGPRRHSQLWRELTRHAHSRGAS